MEEVVRFRSSDQPVRLQWLQGGLSLKQGDNQWNRNLPLSRQADSLAVEQRETRRRQAAVETMPCLVDQDEAPD